MEMLSLADRRCGEADRLLSLYGRSMDPTEHQATCFHYLRRGLSEAVRGLRRVVLYRKNLVWKASPSVSWIDRNACRVSPVPCG